MQTAFEINFDFAVPHYEPCPDGRVLYQFADLNENIELISNPESTLVRDFRTLAKDWQDTTASYALNMRRYAHPTYQRLIGLFAKQPQGDVIPLILEELRERPDIWFEALKLLSGQDPAKCAKTFDDAVASWIAWGKRQRYIS
ncbi:MAG TPA: hypothetical protein VH595_07065 [Verrucomicrobiae bacterium]|jgi:hypothetical protein|nr:hypothetical protein [Verrucomicrobiae bacterium]